MYRLLALFPFIAMPVVAQQDSNATPGQAQWALVEDYCLACHNYEDWAGELAFDLLSPSSVAEQPEVFEAVLRKLDGRLMPPPGSDQPEQAYIDAFLAWLETTLDANTTLPKAGHVPIRRLNRTEYARSVRNLIGVDIDPADYLPTEIEVDGFDNIAAALTVSPAFLNQFIRAARLTAHQAVGDGQAKTAVAYYPPSGDSQTQYIAGMPPGTRGGIAFSHNFPADGEYQFNLLGLGVGLNSSALETAHTVVLLVDGTEVFRAEIGGQDDFERVERNGPAGAQQIMDRFTAIPITLTAGMHQVVATFIERSRAQSLYWSDSGDHNRMPRMGSGIEVVGPFAPTGVSMTPSREKIFVCYPATTEAQRDCARRITENLARRAFGRQVTETDLDLLLPFYDAGMEAGGFDHGIEQVVAAVLASPYFLYRSVTPDPGQESAVYFALDDLELASRLAFFLWSQGPDNTLLDLAIAGRLSEPEVLQAQVRRMLDDPRSMALVDNFAIKWLNLDNLADIDPNTRLFPEYNAVLRQDLAREASRFMASVLLADRPVTELMTADHTYLNESLAEHYDIEGVHGPQFRRVVLTDARRWGLLGKGAVMLSTSYGDRTSPVLRGNWVLERLMGTPSAPPPPGVETDLSVQSGQVPTTVRARLEQHRANPSCNQCHGVIDPIGLALENFSVTGRWRDRDAQAGEEIDAHTVLPGGIAIEGPVELRRELTRKPEKFVRTFTAKLLMYALGRELEYFDMPQVRAIVDQAAANEYRLFDLVMGVVNSDAFRFQARALGGADTMDASAVAANTGR